MAPCVSNKVPKEHPLIVKLIYLTSFCMFIGFISYVSLPFISLVV